MNNDNKISEIRKIQRYSRVLLIECRAVPQDQKTLMYQQVKIVVGFAQNTRIIKDAP